MAAKTTTKAKGSKTMATRSKGNAAAAANNAIAPAPETDVVAFEDQLGELQWMTLDQIDDTSFKNCRSSDWWEAKSSENDPGTPYESLKESIELNGQKDPVTIRRKSGSRNKVPFELVKGFRRYRAVKELADKHKTKNPRIKVIVKDLTDLEAHEENVFENTARENLSGPDLAFAANDLLERYRANGVDMSINALAQRMGKNQGYLSTLVGIVTQAPEVATKWRTEAVNIGYKQMAAVAKLPKQEQSSGYENAKANKPVTGKGQGGQRSGTKPEDKAANTMIRAAGLLGRLEALNIVKVRTKWDTTFAMRLGATDIGKLTQDQQKAVVAKGLEAFQKAIAATKESLAKQALANQNAESGSESEELADDSEELAEAAN